VVNNLTELTQAIQLTEQDKKEEDAMIEEMKVVKTPEQLKAEIDAAIAGLAGIGHLDNIDDIVVWRRQCPH
jgi:hypothetical protein